MNTIFSLWLFAIGFYVLDIGYEAYKEDVLNRKVCPLYVYFISGFCVWCIVGLLPYLIMRWLNA